MSCSAMGFFVLLHLYSSLLSYACSKNRNKMLAVSVRVSV